MPADYGLRPDDLQSVPHARCRPIQPGEYQTIDAAEGQSLRRFTSHHVELMTTRLQQRSRSEQSDQRQPNQAETSLIKQEHRPIRSHLLAGSSFRQ
jgi:hypothetical protein